MKFSPPRAAHGRTPSRSDSSAQSGVSASTMSSFSASVTFDESSPRTSRTITGPALTSRSRRTLPMDGRSNRRSSARSSQFPKLVACITATSGGQRKYQDRPVLSPPAHAGGSHRPSGSFWVPPRILSPPRKAGAGRRGLRAAYQSPASRAPDTTEVYQASGQGFGEGQVVAVVHGRLLRHIPPRRCYRRVARPALLSPSGR